MLEGKKLSFYFVTNAEEWLVVIPLPTIQLYYIFFVWQERIVVPFSSQKVDVVELYIVNTFRAECMISILFSSFSYDYFFATTKLFLFFIFFSFFFRICAVSMCVKSSAKNCVLDGVLRLICAFVCRTCP